VVFISHKLGEVLAIADRITVMRGGRVTAAGIDPKTVTRADLARLMVGRPVLEQLKRTEVEQGRVVLHIEDVRAESDRGVPAVRGASLDVRAGEIVGVAAVAGNGQSELAQVITGLRTCTGSVTVDGREIAALPSREGVRAGVAHVPEDRAGVGSAPNLSLVDNLILRAFRHPPIARGPLLDDRAARSKADGLRQAYAISAPSLDTPVRVLSGGNLQRLILAREIDSSPKVLVAVQPTRGLDVGAIEGVHQLLLDLRAKGTAILLISEELEELLALSDRILVMYEGQIAASFDTPTRDDVEAIGLHMTGGDLSFVPRWLSPLLTVLAVVVALLIGAVVLALVGGDPVKSYLHIIKAAFGDIGVLSDTLVKATPLILTGLACALAFRMRLWNIGAEGQFLLARGARVSSSSPRSCPRARPPSS